MFNKYKEVDGNSRVLLLFLLLGGHKIDKIDHLEEDVEERLFGLKIRKIYGITSEYIDVETMEQEIENIQTPVICSERLFGMYAQSDKLYRYEAQHEGSSLYINDMGVLSKAMMITKDCVVSSNRAVSELEIEEGNFGFMYFADYVTSNRTEIGKWLIQYDSDLDGGKFDIFYVSEGEDNKIYKELIYSISGVDKPSTYKIVLFIIRKVSAQMEDFAPDNFKETVYVKTK